MAREIPQNEHKMTCWMCDRKAVWTITARREGKPAVVVQFVSCEKCVPFAYDAGDLYEGNHERDSGDDRL